MITILITDTSAQSFIRDMDARYGGVDCNVCQKGRPCRPTPLAGRTPEGLASMWSFYNTIVCMSLSIRSCFCFYTGVQKKGGWME